MLIKIVKLMGSLLQEEPRLARKLLEPLATIIQTTPAKSLLYECISTVTQALLYTARGDGTQPKAVPGVVALCTSKLREFVEDADQNLKYLGLVGKQLTPTLTLTLTLTLMNATSITQTLTSLLRPRGKDRRLEDELVTNYW